MANQDKRLDKAVEKTFPASYSVNVGKPTGTETAKRPIDWLPPVTKAQIEASERGEGHAHRDAETSAEHEEARHQKLAISGSPQFDHSVSVISSLVANAAVFGAGFQKGTRCSNQSFALSTSSDGASDVQVLSFFGGRRPVERGRW